MNVSIRAIEEKDFGQIVKLIGDMADFQKQPDKMTNSVDRMKMEKEYFHGFVAADEADKIVGYATHFFAYYTWTGKCLYMDDLFVSELYRKQGIGKKLIEEVINYAKKESCHKLIWQVAKWNTPAVEFYRSLGVAFNDTEKQCILPLK
jgi:GNAT superfamily N-acetyltransferase